MLNGNSAVKCLGEIQVLNEVRAARGPLMYKLNF